MVKYHEGSTSPALLLSDDHYWGIRSGLYDLFTNMGTRKIGMYLDGAAAPDRLGSVVTPYPPQLVDKHAVGNERVEQINSEATRLWAEIMYLTGAFK